MSAFGEMEKAGGLGSWRMEARGPGRTKSYRVHYTHGLPRAVEQGALELEQPTTVE